MRTQFEERGTPVRAAIEYGDIVSRLHEVRRHGRTHVTQSDESDFHGVISVMPLVDRCSGAMNSGPTGSVIVSLRMRSILASAAASSDHPATPRVARN